MSDKVPAYIWWWLFNNNKETNNGSNKRTTEKGSLPRFLGNAGKEQEVSSIFASLLIGRCNTGNESQGTIQSDWMGLIEQLAGFCTTEETFLGDNEDNLEIHWDFDYEEGEGEWKPEEHYYGTLGEDMERTVRTDDGNMEKGLEKVLEDYKGALQMLDDYDHGRLTEEQMKSIRQEQKRILHTKT